jgi:hypothetical protein
MLLNMGEFSTQFPVKIVFRCSLAVVAAKGTNHQTRIDVDLARLRVSAIRRPPSAGVLGIGGHSAPTTSKLAVSKT